MAFRSQTGDNVGQLETWQDCPPLMMKHWGVVISTLLILGVSASVSRMLPEAIVAKEIGPSSQPEAIQKQSPPSEARDATLGLRDEIRLPASNNQINNIRYQPLNPTYSPHNSDERTHLGEIFNDVSDVNRNDIQISHQGSTRNDVDSSY